MMRIFLLRHEARPPHDPTFWTALTPAGTRNAMYKVTPTLQTDVQPTTIYTSPLLRCIQTVAPYCAVNRLRGVLRTEPALFERVRGAADPLDPEDAKERRFENQTFRTQSVLDNPSYDHLHAYIDRNYTPCQPSATLVWGETADMVRARAQAFGQRMVAEHGTGEDARVLVVSHRSVLNALLNRDDEAPFEMGAVEEVPPTVWRAWGDRGGEGSVDAQSK